VRLDSKSYISSISKQHIYCKLLESRWTETAFCNVFFLFFFISKYISQVGLLLQAVRVWDVYVLRTV